MHRAADASSLERARDLQTQLGKGSQGVVWKAKRKADGVLVAIKQIMLGSIFRREQADAAQEVAARCPVPRALPHSAPLSRARPVAPRPASPLRSRVKRRNCLSGAAAGFVRVCGHKRALVRAGWVRRHFEGAHAGMPSLCGGSTRSGCWRG